jgi:formate dehydrogenase gamma subunit
MNMAEKRTYRRFSLAQQIEHWLLTAAFTTLAVTGLSQKFAATGWGDRIIALLGGIETTRIIHRWAAIAIIAISLYHIIAVAYRVLVLQSRLTMLPSLKDVRDALDALRYNLGLAKNWPKMPRFNFGEKMEYWAMVWGMVLMGITGFMLWNPIATTRWLPGDFVPAAKVAHGAEAVLAVLAIIVWHSYNVHLKTFNKSMFTGRLDEEEMRHEHALELELMQKELVGVPIPREVKRRRERIFIPVAGVAVVAFAVGLYLFATFEQTAITTIPPAEQAQAFVPATPIPTVTPTETPTPVPTPVAAATPAETPTASPIPHPLEGRENCLLCHALDAIKPFPANHERWGNPTCLACHAEQDREPPEPAAASPGFAAEVLPIFTAKCGDCHGTLGGLALTDYDGIMKGGLSGPAITPGDPDGSLLIKKMAEGHLGEFTDEELAIVRAWIAAGAPDN